MSTIRAYLGIGILLFVIFSLQLSPLLADEADALGPSAAYDDIEAHPESGAPFNAAKTALTCHLVALHHAFGVAGIADEAALADLFARHDDHRLTAIPTGCTQPVDVTIDYHQLIQLHAETPLFTVPVMLVKDGARYDFLLAFTTVPDEDDGFLVRDAASDGELLAAEIGRIWGSVPSIEEVALDDEAQIALTAIATLASPDELEALDARSWYRLAVARLYADHDARFVIDLAERAKAHAGRDAPVRTELLNNHAFVKLYLMARLIQTQTLEAIDQAGGHAFFDRAAAYFYRPDSFQVTAPWTPTERAEMNGAATEAVCRMSAACEARGDARRAIGLLKALIAYLHLSAGEMAEYALSLYEKRLAAMERRVAEGELGMVVAQWIDGAGLPDGPETIAAIATEAQGRFERYLNRAVASATGTGAACSVPRLTDELGEAIIISRALPPELDLRARQIALDVAGSLTHDLLRAYGVAVGKSGERTRTVGDLSRNLIDQFARRGGEKPWQEFEVDVFAGSVEAAARARAAALADRPARIAAARAALPRAYAVNAFDRSGMRAVLSDAGCPGVDALDGRAALIFSERVTFDNGLGILLEKLARIGMPIVVVTTTDHQRALVAELNEGKREDQKIRCAETVAAARGVVSAARYYYFKVAGDPDAHFGGVTTFDITGLVRKIVAALGKLTGIAEPAKIEALEKAARLFAQAA